MPSTFHPRLVNGSFEDPALFIALMFRKQALLFDLGDLSALSNKDILKISHVFVTHTHMDHFVGFDQVLRLMLGRPKWLHLYGPQGFLDNVAGKLKAYAWNLVQNFANALVLEVTEIRPDQRLSQTFDCRSGFEPTPLRVEIGPCRLAYQDPELSITTVVLDHQIPCLGFCLQERFHVHVLTTGLKEMGLQVGPWLSNFKSLLYHQADPSTQITIPMDTHGSPPRRFELSRLAEKIAIVSPGRKMAYVADVVYSRANEEKIVHLAQNADHLFIEAAFLENENRIAQAKFHLTAHQAGTIARKAGVRQVTLFHHSPRYLGQAQLLVEEARRAFESGP